MTGLGYILGDDWLQATGPHLPRLTLAAQKGWENTGRLPGVADCGRSQKWGCRGRLVPGLKPRLGSHARRGNHAVWGLPWPHSLGSQKARCSSDTGLSLSSLEECRRDAAGKNGVEGLLLGGPGEGATRIWIENWRSQQHS